VATSQAGFISDAISNVVQALLVGGILAFLVLFLFLRDARYPVAIAVAIPISVVGSFALLDAAGVSLNIMTLGGLALGVGMLVDNSIVVLENIFRHRERGKAPRGGRGRLGAEEVQGAITASTLTTISVFGPIVYVEGVAGELFGALALAVAFSLLVSLLVALTLLPVLASRWGEEGEHRARARGSARRVARGLALGRLDAARSTPSTAASRRLAGRYHERARSERALEHPGPGGRLALGLLLAGLAVGASSCRAPVLPDVDQGAFRVALELERGTPLERPPKRLRSGWRRRSCAPTPRWPPSSPASAAQRRRGVETARGRACTPPAGRRPAAGRRRHAPRASSGCGRAMDVGAAPGSRWRVGETGGRPPRSAGCSAAGSRPRGAGPRRRLDGRARLRRRRRRAAPGHRPLTNVRVGTELGQPEIRVEIDRERAAASASSRARSRGRSSATCAA
jgi:hydrophobic/amphiphilic exporter-1 (mainly G- bacteria), HAE1 family